MYICIASISSQSYRLNLLHRISHQTAAGIKTSRKVLLIAINWIIFFGNEWVPLRDVLDNIFIFILLTEKATEQNPWSYMRDRENEREKRKSDRKNERKKEREKKIKEFEWKQHCVNESLTETHILKCKCILYLWGSPWAIIPPVPRAQGKQIMRGLPSDVPEATPQNWRSPPECPG